MVHMIRYGIHLLKCLESYEDVSSMFLMEELNDWWGYGFQIRETGITLLLEHFVIMYDEGINDAGKWENTHYLVSDESFDIHQTKANLLTLSLYSPSATFSKTLFANLPVP